MKHFKFSIGWLTVLALIFTSCSKEESDSVTSDDVAVLTLGADLADFENSTKQSSLPECTDAAPDYALVTFSYGDVVRTDVEVDILSDDDGLFTAYNEMLEIPVMSGNTVVVTLHDFKIFAAGGGDPIWVAPKEDSDYAAFVSRPVGDDFDITLRAGSKNYTDVEVLCFDDREVNRYGYQFFDIVPTPLQPVCFFANYCPDGPNGRDRVANYSLELYIFEGTPENDPDTEGQAYTEIYGNEDLSPMTGSNPYYADPLCVAIPILGAGEYLYYEVTLEDWPGNYPNDGEGFISGYLDQAAIDILLGDDEDTVDYLHLFFNCGDTPPPVGDCPAGTDPDGDGLCNPNDDCPNTHVDNDADGDCLPDGDDPCPYDPENDCEGNEIPEGCETAYMFGDYELADLGLQGGKNWGWGLVIDADDIAAEADGVWEIPFYAGAGQNDYENNGYQAGYIILTLDEVEGTLAVTFDLEDDVTRNDTHIWVSSDWPISRAPGNFDMDDDDDIYPLGDGDIYVIVHAEVCGDGDDD